MLEPQTTSRSMADRFSSVSKCETGEKMAISLITLCAYRCRLIRHSTVLCFDGKYLSFVHCGQSFFRTFSLAVCGLIATAAYNVAHEKKSPSNKNSTSSFGRYDIRSLRNHLSVCVLNEVNWTQQLQSQVSHFLYFRSHSTSKSAERHTA